VFEQTNNMRRQQLAFVHKPNKNSKQQVINHATGGTSRTLFHISNKERISGKTSIRDNDVMDISTKGLNAIIKISDNNPQIEFSTANILIVEIPEDLVLWKCDGVPRLAVCTKSRVLLYHDGHIDSKWKPAGNLRDMALKKGSIIRGGKNGISEALRCGNQDDILVVNNGNVEWSAMPLSTVKVQLQNAMIFTQFADVHATINYSDTASLVPGDNIITINTSTPHKDCILSQTKHFDVRETDGHYVGFKERGVYVLGFSLRTDREIQWKATLKLLDFHENLVDEFTCSSIGQEIFCSTTFEIHEGEKLQLIVNSDTNPILKRLTTLYVGRMHDIVE